MAAAMLPRLVAVAALVALMCAVAVAQVPAAGGAPTCDIVDQNVVNACYKSFGVGHSCLCKMKKKWQAQGKKAQDNVQCVREKAC
ncbi:hypothetical protein ZWY2020_012280 [Hordeum vulgare]|nr:hypothetical protein ZWY2020_012280 [Hordeum vulgare]